MMARPAGRQRQTPGVAQGPDPRLPTPRCIDFLCGYTNGGSISGRACEAANRCSRTRRRPRLSPQRSMTAPSRLRGRTTI
eukprot:2421483-Lingulodinium_polyedra.AAC.1